MANSCVEVLGQFAERCRQIAPPLEAMRRHERDTRSVAYRSQLVFDVSTPDDPTSSGCAVL